MAWIEPSRIGVFLNLRVSPGAAKTAVAGEHGNVLKVRVQAPPEKGKANKALVEFLSKELRIAPSRIEVISGKQSRNKRVEISGVDVRHIEQILGAEGGQDR